MRGSFQVPFFYHPGATAEVVINMRRAACLAMYMQRKMKKTIKHTVDNILDHFGYQLRKFDLQSKANAATLGKACAHIERFREIVSDPLNLLIRRVPSAGFLNDGGCVFLHNGNIVPLRGKFSYYSGFSDILIINRGVHEPLEEFCFQEVLSRLDSKRPIMLELGAYWSHYSMWLKLRHPEACCYMVEPDPIGLECGKHNFRLNGYEGTFINEGVGASGFQVDQFTASRTLGEIDILHADIQGAEVEMLRGGHRFLSHHGAKYIFISTHSTDLHLEVIAQLKQYGYRIEISSDVLNETTSLDGFVFASAPNSPAMFAGFYPIGRLEIAGASTSQILKYLNSVNLD